MSVTLTLGGLFWEVFVKSGVELVGFAEPSHSANRHLALPDCDETTILAATEVITVSGAPIYRGQR